MNYNGKKLILPDARELLASAVPRPTAAQLAALADLVEKDNSTVADGRELAQLVRNAVLFTAIMSDDPGAVADAIDAGAQVNARNTGNLTPVMLACSRRNVAVLSLILGRRPDLSLQDNTGWTALHRAVYDRDADVVRQLLTADPPLTVPSFQGVTPLALAANCCTAPIAMLVYDYALAKRDVLTAREIEEMRTHLYQDATFTSAARLLLEDSFLQVAGADVTVTDLDSLPGQLRAHIGGMYDAIAAEATRRLPGAGLSDAQQKMVAFALTDLSRLKSAVLYELDHTPENVIRLIGHLAHASGQVLVGAISISVGGWAPANALWYQCLVTAHLLRTEKFNPAEERYLRQELARTADALIRAEELYLVEAFFVAIFKDEVRAPYGDPRTAAGLARLYVRKAAAATQAMVLPCGNRRHATYLTVTSQGGQRVDLCMHNLGRLVNKYHKSPAPHQYLPFTVVGVDIGSLQAILEPMISAYVLLADNDQDAALAAVYETISAGGTVVPEPELARRFRPMLRQVANNCSIANLQSADMELGVTILDDGFADFERRIRALELGYAEMLWNQIRAQTAVQPPVPVIRASGQLRRAIYLGDLPACTQLLTDQPAAISVIDDEGQTLLHLVARAGSVQLTDLMLRCDPDSTKVDRAGKLAIEYVVGWSDPVVRRELLNLMTPRFPRRFVKSYIVIPHTVPFYRDQEMGSKIGEIDAEEDFIELAKIGDKKLKILFFDGKGTPWVGYITTEHVK